MLIVKLTKEEEEVVEGHYKKSNTRLIRERAHAILLNNEGESAPRIARILRRSENTVRDWLKSFKETRISSIFPAYENNLNASKLTREQREEIKKILKSPSSQQGISKEFWTTENLKTYLKASFGVVYESDRSYHFLFELADLSFKRPSPFDIRRDEEHIEKRMAEIREEIKPFMKQDEWVVLVSDEARIVWESEIRRAWLKKGEKTTLKVQRKRKAQNFIGMLNLKTGKPHLYQLPWQKQETILSALKKLEKRYPKKNICLIWDNASFHKGKLIKKELAKGGALHNFHLIPLPPYAPDKNPQEKIWNYGKNVIANTHGQVSFDTLVKQFKKTILRRSFSYQL